MLLLRPVPHLAGVAWFETEEGGDQIHLLHGPGAAESSAHLALQVDDLADTLDRARAAGADLRAGSQAWGAERWFLRDTAGNLVEVFEVPPPANPR